MKSGQTPVRTSGEWAFSYKEREIEREEIKREVQRVEAINKGRKRD
jgi:hypothetical protein